MHDLHVTVEAITSTCYSLNRNKYLVKLSRTNWLQCTCLQPFTLFFFLFHLFSVKAYSSSTSLDQQHQSAAKDLTGSPVRSTPSTIQVTYLPSTGQRSKRPKHFLELKSFKDNYNTLESTLWNISAWTDRHMLLVLGCKNVVKHNSTHREGMQKILDRAVKVQTNVNSNKMFWYDPTFLFRWCTCVQVKPKLFCCGPDFNYDCSLLGPSVFLFLYKWQNIDKISFFQL